MIKGGKKGFETGAEDDGFNIYSGVVKNMTVGRGNEVITYCKHANYGLV